MHVYPIPVSANRIAKLANTTPLVLFMIVWAFGDRTRKSRNAPPMNATAPNTTIVAMINIDPRVMTCIVTNPFSGLTNCGRKAKKKIEIFGLIRFIITPRR